MSENVMKFPTGGNSSGYGAALFAGLSGGGVVSNAPVTVNSVGPSSSVAVVPGAAYFAREIIQIANLYQIYSILYQIYSKLWHFMQF